MTTALTLPQRAAVALNSSKYEQDLLILIDQSKDLIEAKDNAGRDQIHRAAMTLSNARIAITKISKSAREDATAFSKAVIAEESRLVAIVKPHEDRLFAARDIYDEKIEAEKQAKIVAERERVGNIKVQIGYLHSEILSAIGKTIHQVRQRLEIIEREIPDELNYQEFLSEALSVHADVVSKLKTLISDLEIEEQQKIKLQKEREAEQSMLKAEREENDRIRKQLEDQQKIHTAELLKQRMALEAEQLIAKQAKDKLDAEKAAFETDKQAKIDVENKVIADAKQKRLDEIDAAEKMLIEEPIDSFAELVKTNEGLSPKEELLWDREKMFHAQFFKDGEIIAERNSKKLATSKNGVILAVAEYYKINMDLAEQLINYYFKG